MFWADFTPVYCDSGLQHLGKGRVQVPALGREQKWAFSWAYQKMAPGILSSDTVFLVKEEMFQGQ